MSSEQDKRTDAFFQVWESKHKLEFKDVERIDALKAILKDYEYVKTNSNK